MVPTGPKVGLSEIVAEVTVNFAVAESPDGVPVTTTVYTPGAAVPLTLKEPDTEPLAENVHVAAVAIDDGILETQA
jgi:hypothetical protein